jgi:hypothetical protein
LGNSSTTPLQALGLDGKHEFEPFASIPYRFTAILSQGAHSVKPNSATFQLSNFSAFAIRQANRPSPQTIFNFVHV